MPEMTLSIVVLPAPLGPIRPRISPGLTSRSMPSSTFTPPKLTETPRTESSAALIGRTSLLSEVVAVIVERLPGRARCNGSSQPRTFALRKPMMPPGIRG